MKTYKNWKNQEISFSPFYQSCLKLYRVSRRVNGELSEVYENKGFQTRKECESECTELFKFWNQ